MAEENKKTEEKNNEEELEDEEEKLEKGVVLAEISEEMQKAYIDYAMSVIVARALPSVEDGLKPVQRRILYAMDKMGLDKGQTVKSAKVVGNVLGNYHPHGDMAVYDAMVRMAQDFSLRYPLVHGQGNWGSLDGDAAAAMRYCVSGNSLIITDRGMERIDEISDKEEIKRNILSKDKKINNASKWFDSGEHETLKIITNKGYSLIGSKNHPILTLSKDDFGRPIFIWKTLEQIKIGDIAVIDRKEDNFWPEKETELKEYYPQIKDKHQHVRILPERLDENLSFLLGAMVSEGSIKWNKLEFCNTDERFIIEFEERWKKIFPDSRLHKFKRNPSSYGKKQYFRLECHCRYTLEFLKNIGLEFVKSDKKTIPRLLLKSPKNVLVSFLRAYFEGDGGIDCSKKMVELSCCSKSEELINELQIVLLRLGIESAKRFDKWKFINKLYIRGKRNVLRFYKEIGFFSERKSKKLEFVVLRYKKDYSITDYVPFISDFIRELSHNEFIMKNNFDRYSYMEKNYQKVSSIVLRKTKQNISPLFEYFLTYNYLFEPIIQIEDAGIQKVYSIKVDSSCHSFISNGFISHNTEAKLGSISTELLEDIDKETVSFVPNFDNSTKEPETLPAKLPNLLINGATGIAVGMATNIPPHNLTEVTDAIIAYINNQDITIEKLCEIIPGPDFPTGGSVNAENILELYKTGKGRFVMRGKVTTEEEKSRESIIITEIPYMVNKSDLVAQIAKLVQEKKLPDISDLRDESSKGKVRIVIELRKGADSKFTLNRLYKFTRLQDTFDVNMLALVNGQPRTLGLKQFIEEYVKYRKLTVTRRCKFDLKKAEERLEIVEGLLIALKNIDAIIDLIKKSKNATEAAENLMKKYPLTKRQTQAVLETKLQQLTSLEHEKLKKELQELKEKIDELKKILADEREILSIIKKEISEIKRKYGDNRRTYVLQRISEFSEKDLVQKKEVIVTITDKGYVKRIDVKSYKEQKRGGKGMIGSDLATGDFVKQLITCSTHDYLLFFTNKGRVYWVKAFEVPESERYSKGKSIANLLNLKEETIASVIDVKKFEGFLMLVTKQGIAKKMLLSMFSKPRASGVRAINLPAGDADALIDAKKIEDKQEVLLITSRGQAIRFNSNEVRNMGRASYGVTGIKLEKTDRVVSLEVLPLAEQAKTTILSITENGYGKRSAIEDYRLTGRACKGVINLKVTNKTGNVITTCPVEDKDGIIVTTAKGMVIRTNVKNIRVMGRATQGVHIVRLQKDDKVTDLVKIPEAEIE